MAADSLTSTAPGIWRCASCGSYVPSGITHFCNGGLPMVSAPQPDPLERIAAALERIADALDEPGDMADPFAPGG